MAVTLWRSKRAGKPRGPWLASWREGGRKVAFNTKTEDHTEAIRIADAEWGRRQTQSSITAGAASQPPVPPDAEPEVVTFRRVPPPAEPLHVPSAWSPPPPTTNGYRKPIADVLARAVGVDTGEASSSSSSAPPRPTTTSEPSAGGTEYVFGAFARAATFLTQAGLKHAIRLAGREPDEMEESEEKMIEAGWKEIGAKWFGQTELGPWGKVMMATATAGVGMYMGGTPIEKPADEPKALAAADKPASEGAGD